MPFIWIVYSMQRFSRGWITDFSESDWKSFPGKQRKCWSHCFRWRLTANPDFTDSCRFWINFRYSGLYPEFQRKSSWLPGTATGKLVPANQLPIKKTDKTARQRDLLRKTIIFYKTITSESTNREFHTSEIDNLKFLENTQRSVSGSAGRRSSWAFRY